MISSLTEWLEIATMLYYDVMIIITNVYKSNRSEFFCMCGLWVPLFDLFIYFIFTWILL